MKLSDAKLRAIKPTGKTQKIFDGQGLYVHVRPQGSPSAGGMYWRLDYRHGGKARTLAIGVYPAVSLKDARSRRDEAKALLAQGIDPSEHKQSVKADAQARKENTFELVARTWFEKFQGTWTPKTLGNKLSRMERYVYPFIGPKPIDEITVADVRSVLQRIDNLGALTVAQNVLNEISHVFRFAVARELVQFDIAAGLRGSLPPVRTKHFPSITEPKRIGELMRAIDSFSGNRIIKLALQLIAYTFVRSNELRKASWSEIDFESAVWRIPAERMKMRRPHIVPLSQQAVEFFRELREYTGFGGHVLPAMQSVKMRDNVLSDVALLSALRRLGYSKDEMTIHGFRSMASTLLNEMGHRPDLIELQLAHGERNAVRAAYNHAQHLEERRAMMQEYADLLDELRDAVPSQ